MREIGFLGKGSYGTVMLVEDKSMHEQIASKTVPIGGQDVSDLFFREIQFLIRPKHPCVVRFVSYFLAMGTSGAQVGTEFAANGSLREALGKSAAFLDDTGKAIVVVGVVVGMKFVHSQGIIHRDLKPANILLDGRGYPKIGDLGSGQFFDLSLTMTSKIGTPRYMAPEMLTDEEYSRAVDVYSFSLILYELLVGEAAFPATLGPGVLVEKVRSGARPLLPGDMDNTVRGIISRCWSVDPSKRDSFEVIFGLLRGIEFKVTPAVNSGRVYRFLSQVGCDCGSDPRPREGMDAFRREEERPSGISERSGLEKARANEFGAKGPRSPPNEVARLTCPIECPAFKKVMEKPLFGKPKPVQKPAMKKGKGHWANTMMVPDGIIAYLTRECGGNVHDRHVVEVTCGSFEKETQGANPHSGAFGNDPRYAAKNIADLNTDSLFSSAYRDKKEDIPHTRNNWVCYDFKERWIRPTHYTIRTHDNCLFRNCHLKSWLVEMSVNGESWWGAAREEDNGQLNGPHFIGTFPVTGGGACRFIRLVNIGKNHCGNDYLIISAWEIFGSLIE
jgi:hypothetical protein